MARAWLVPVLASLIGLVGAGAQAQDQAYGQAFVAAFEQACVPGRLSYEDTQKIVLDAGWMAVAEDADPELAELMARSAAGMAEAEADGIGYEVKIFGRQVAGVSHYLVVGKLTSDIFDALSCHLYNFAATEVIDPALVTALIGNPVAQELREEDITSYVWGPPPAMPRTLDTYLTFIPEGSSYLDQTGFSGLMLKFETSLPELQANQ